MQTSLLINRKRYLEILRKSNEKEFINRETCRRRLKISEELKKAKKKITGGGKI
jgi:hypothetical protein